MVYVLLGDYCFALERFEFARLLVLRLLEGFLHSSYRFFILCIYFCVCFHFFFSTEMSVQDRKAFVKTLLIFHIINYIYIKTLLGAARGVIKMAYPPLGV